VSGLWHGANWTFIIWGALHGFYLIFALITKNIKERVNKFFHLDQLPFLSVLTTFILVTFAWIFFRADNLHVALYISKHIFTGLPELFNKIINHQSVYEYIGLSAKYMVLSVLLIILLEMVHVLQNRFDLSQLLIHKPTYIRWAIYSGIIILIVFLGVFEERQFIYFQF
jgi:D-alanyl-lipoteichoic acid acyltransferase DltB (MBOAT superfamily)